MNNNEYECAFCHGIFGRIRDENWNEEEVEEEYKEMFPGKSIKNRDIVCDDCWQIVKPWPCYYCGTKNHPKDDKCVMCGKRIGEK
jgi:hypothetical protein